MLTGMRLDDSDGGRRVGRINGKGIGIIYEKSVETALREKMGGKIKVME